MPFDLIAIQVRAVFFLGDIIDRLKLHVLLRRADQDDRGPTRQIAEGGPGWWVGSAEAGARSTRGALARAILFFIPPWRGHA